MNERVTMIVDRWPHIVSADLAVLTRPIQIQADTLVIEVFDRSVQHKRILKAAQRVPGLLRPRVARRKEPASTAAVMGFLAQDILRALDREVPAAMQGINQLRFRVVPRPLHLRLVS